MNRTRWLAAGCIGVGLALGFSLHATGNGLPAMRAAAPTAVATLNLDALFNNLDELKARRGTLENKIKELEAEPKRILEEMKKIDEELNTLNLSDQEALDRRLRFGVLNQEREAQLKAAQLLINIEEGRIFRETYTKAMEVVQQVAQREGIDLVLLDDRAIKLPEGPGASSRDVQAAILARQILYAGESIDITDMVVREMNNNYAAGR